MSDTAGFRLNNNDSGLREALKGGCVGVVDFDRRHRACLWVTERIN